jgi:hypothetical protein
VRFRVSIIFKGKLNCLYFAIKALKVCAEIKNFYVKYGRHASNEVVKNGVGGGREGWIIVGVID